MNAIDLVCLITLVLCGVLGARRGFLHSSATLFGWALSGFFLAKRYPSLENQLQALEFSPEITSWLASALCALAVLWFFYFLSGWIRDFAHAFGFLEADKVLGGLGGTALGWVGFAFLISIANEFTKLEEKRVWKSSLVVKLVESWEASHEPKLIRSVRGIVIQSSNALKKNENLSLNVTLKSLTADEGLEPTIRESESSHKKEPAEAPSSASLDASEPTVEEKETPMPPKKFSKKRK